MWEPLPDRATPVKDLSLTALQRLHTTGLARPETVRSLWPA